MPDMLRCALLLTLLFPCASSLRLGLRHKNFASHRKTLLMTNDNGYDIDVDIAVIGGGIAGSSISWVLQENEGCKVALIDPRVNIPGTWYPNYGEWRDEWHLLSDRMKLPELKDCTTTEWEITDCFFGGSNDIPADQRTTITRPYVRVDRIKMQALLRQRFAAAGGLAVDSKVSSTRISPNLFDRGITHDKKGTSVELDDGRKLRCKVLVDATGLESKLVAKESPIYARGNEKELVTGYQIAYGFIAVVDKLESYDSKAMTLFDYRTTHLDDDPEWLKDGSDKPTFMYTMPLGIYANGSHRVFFEETSLVGAGSRRLSFEECKKRAFKRLKHWDINVIGIEEEEYCYIPMGGELPDSTQRIIGFGGAANMVHPSTGYHAVRMLAASTDVAAAIARGVKEDAPPDAISAAAYKEMWGRENRLQRDFQAYGGDFLMKQPVEKLRGFFSAFFAVDQLVWSGFLAGWPGLPGNEYHDTWNARFGFALKLFVEMPNDVRVAMTLYAIKYTIEFGPATLLRSLTPGFLFGPGPADPEWKPASNDIGDVEAKDEARRMMKEFKSTAHSTIHHSNTAVAEAAAAAETTAAADTEQQLPSYPAPFN